MTRLSWSRYSGDEIEAVVAMFISALHPEAERITPSKGDGGIDVLVRGDVTRVYQVKKFSGPLTGNQKKQVQKSIDALTSDRRVAGLKVDEWHVVMPWDPTLEAKQWLADYGALKGLPNPIWDGLTKCDLWASQFPHVVDWYLGGNAERVQQLALDLVHAARLKDISGDDLASFDVSTFAADLHRTMESLNQQDPFFAYGVSVDPRQSGQSAPSLQDSLVNAKPGAVLSTRWGDDRVSVQVDVYPKNRVALELNPIQFNIKLTAEGGSDRAKSMHDFARFGTPMELEGLDEEVSLAAPGGLGGTFQAVALAVLPAAEVPEQAREVRLFLHDEAGREVDQLVLFRRYSTSGLPVDETGAAGAEALFADEFGVLKARMRHDAVDEAQTAGMSLSYPAGQLASKVVPVLRFWQNMNFPNTITIAPRYGPVHSTRHPLPQREGDGDSPAWLEMAESLSLIQERTPVPLHMPDLWDGNGDLVASILATGAHLKGHILQRRADFLAVEHDSGDADRGENIVMLMPWEIELPEAVVDLGVLAYAFVGRLHGRKQEGPDGLFDIWAVDGGVVMSRMPSDDEREFAEVETAS